MVILSNHYFLFFRLHEPPKPTMMKELQRNLETVGMHIDISSSGGIQASLNKYQSEDFLGKLKAGSRFLHICME